MVGALVQAGRPGALGQGGGLSHVLFHELRIMSVPFLGGTLGRQHIGMAKSVGFEFPGPSCAV